MKLATAALLTKFTVDAEPEAPLESVTITVTGYVAPVVYTCCTLVVLPGNVPLTPSPKSTLTDVIALPAVGVAVIVKVVGVPVVGLGVADEIETTSCGLGVTVTLPVPVDVSPKVSTAVTLMV